MSLPTFATHKNGRRQKRIISNFFPNRDVMDNVAISAPKSKSKKRIITAILGLAIVAGGGVVVLSKGTGGLKSRIIRLAIPQYGLTKPIVMWYPRPVNGEHDVLNVKTLSVRIHIRNAKDPINHLD